MTPPTDRQQRALIIWSASKERRALYKIVAATGATVEFADELDAKLAEDLSLIIVDFDALGARASRVFDALRQLNSRPAVLAITAHGNREQMAELFSHDVLTNLFVANVAPDATELVVTVQKILRRDIFGLEKYLTWGVHAEECVITDSNQKHELMDRLATSLRDLGCNSRLTRLAQGAADELVMNAVYNAPVDAEGKPKYASLSRTQRVQLEPHERPVFRYACDGRDLALSVSDPFGQLSRDTVLSYLRRCFTAADDQIRQETGGAGLGLYYIFESLNHFIVNVAPGKRTELIGLLNISGTYRDFAERPRSIHLFYENGSAQ